MKRTRSLMHAWWRELRYPTLLFVSFAALFAVTDLDVTIANRWFFDGAGGGWVGAHNWWIESFIHTGGRWAMRVVVVVAAVFWLLSIRNQRLQPLQRPLAYFVVASVLAIGIVGLLKTITNVDCPWDLEIFGGRFPLVHLFADRSDALRRAHCFPAAHASSGYALVALYFAWRERSRSTARLGLMIGIACGIVFGLAQQARGAHFVSHDLWSVYLVWLVTATVYVFGFSMRLHGGATVATDGTIEGARDQIIVSRRAGAVRM